MKKTEILAALKATIAKVGTLREDDTAYMAEAPAGTVWKASGCHELVTEWRCIGERRDRLDWRIEALRDIAEQAAMGTEPCGAIPSCDWCNPPVEELDQIERDAGRP